MRQIRLAMLMMCAGAAGAAACDKAKTADSAGGVPSKPAATAGRTAGATPTSTMAGVYSEEQAARGKTVYEIQCAACHLSLGNHTGPIFRSHWAGASVNDLFAFMSA